MHRLNCFGYLKLLAIHECQISITNFKNFLFLEAIVNPVYRKVQKYGVQRFCYTYVSGVSLSYVNGMTKSISLVKVS